MQKLAILAAIVLSAAPAMAHPGHGLPEGLAHDAFHAATAAAVIAIVVLSAVEALRRRRARKDRGHDDDGVAP